METEIWSTESGACPPFCQYDEHPQGIFQHEVERREAHNIIVRWSSVRAVHAERVQHRGIEFALRCFHRCYAWISATLFD